MVGRERQHDSAGRREAKRRQVEVSRNGVVFVACDSSGELLSNVVEEHNSSPFTTEKIALSSPERAGKTPLRELSSTAPFGIFVGPDLNAANAAAFKGTVRESYKAQHNNPMDEIMRQLEVMQRKVERTEKDSATFKKRLERTEEESAGFKKKLKRTQEEVVESRKESTAFKKRLKRTEEESAGFKKKLVRTVKYLRCRLLDTFLTHGINRVSS
jgi:hypothetical protein